MLKIKINTYIEFSKVKGFIAECEDNQYYSTPGYNGSYCFSDFRTTLGSCFFILCQNKRSWSRIQTRIYTNSCRIVFSILLTLEIMETIKAFRHDHQAKIQIILIIVMIAISRKEFVLDIRDANIEEGLAIAALILAFSASYFFVRIRNNKKPKETDIEPGERDFINRLFISPLPWGSSAGRRLII